MPWANSRPTHVPTAVRQAALDRDGHQCTAIRQDGTRCPETRNLEADEITRWHRGKRLTVDDIRTLCHWHHNLVTQQQAAQARKASPPPQAARPPEKHPGLR